MTTVSRRASKAFLAAGLFVGVVSIQPALAQSGANTAEDERVFFDQLAAQPYAGPISNASEPVDFASLFDDLPEGLSLQTGTVSVDAATGATVVEDFAIVYDLEGADVGLLAEQVRFYNFSPAAILDRAAGSNTDQSVKVADRIELREVRSIGMEAVSEHLMRGYENALDEFTPLEDAIIAEVTATETLSYNLEIEQMLLDGFTLEPFDMVLSADDAEVDDAQLALQVLAAGARAFSFDALMYTGVVADMSMSVDGIDVSFDVSMPMNGLRGYDRGDLAFSGTWDNRIEGELPFPVSEVSDEVSSDEFRVVPMAGGIAYSAISDVKLQKAFEALSSWKMPESSDTDFMRIGTFEIANYDLEIDELSFFNADYILIDADFHWLLPKSLNVALEGVGYELGNLFTVLADDLAGDFDEDFTFEQFLQALEIAKSYDFDCLCGDYNLSIDWDEETGAIDYRERGSFADAFSSSTQLDLSIPKPSAIADLMLNADADEDEVLADLMLATEFRSAEMTVSDIGGFDRLFPMLHAIGEAFPEVEGMAVLAYNEPEQLRSLAYNMMIGVKPMVRKEFPPADPWMSAAADFIQEGGSLKISVIPPAAINAELIESLAGGEPEPHEIVEILGFSITHTK